MSEKFFLWGMLIFWIFATSCGTGKKSVRDNHVSKRVTVSTNAEETAFDFNTLSAKLGVTYKNKNNKLGVSATIRVKKDSIIWISITPMFGIEALRVVLTKDSVKMINKLSKEYVADNYNFIKQLINIDVDYRIVENIIIGNSISGTEDIFVQDVRIDADNNKVSRMILRSRHDPRTKLVADYWAFKDLVVGVFPSKMQFCVPDRSVKMNIEYSKIVIDKDNMYPFSFPDSYKKMIKL